MYDIFIEDAILCAWIIDISIESYLTQHVTKQMWYASNSAKPKWGIGHFSHMYVYCFMQGCNKRKTFWVNILRKLIKLLYYFVNEDIHSIYLKWIISYDISDIVIGVLFKSLNNSKNRITSYYLSKVWQWEKGQPFII